MPKIRKPKLLENSFISNFNYDKIRISVRNYFQEYRQKKELIDIVSLRYNSPLGSNNVGTVSSSISDTTGTKAIKCIEYQNYIDSIEKCLRPLKLKLTIDEKIILNLSILSNLTDDEVANELLIEKGSIYHRKKSCYIKVALYFGLEVYN